MKTEREKALELSLAAMTGLLESYLLWPVLTGEGSRRLAERHLAEAKRALFGPPSEPTPHDVDECEDYECAVCSEYHGGRDDGGSTQDEDSRYAPLIDPEKERARLAQRETP